LNYTRKFKLQTKHPHKASRVQMISLYIENKHPNSVDDDRHSNQVDSLSDAST